MTSSSYLELLKLKQAKLWKMINSFESGVGERSDFANKNLCGGDSAFINHSNDAVLKLTYIRNVKIECHSKKLSELRGLYGCKKPFKCLDCKYAAISKALLNEHRVRKHWKSTWSCQKVFICDFDECNFRTTFNSYAIDHRRRHLKMKPFKCQHNGCRLSFASQGNLQQHEMMHDEKKRFRCKQNNCNFATKYISNLRMHQTTHSSVRAFRCSHENCTYAAKLRNNLRKHLQTHSEAKSYKCHFNGCSFATKHKGSFQRHVSRHKNTSNSNVVSNCG